MGGGLDGQTLDALSYFMRQTGGEGGRGGGRRREEGVGQRVLIEEVEG